MIPAAVSIARTILAERAGICQTQARSYHEGWKGREEWEGIKRALVSLTSVSVRVRPCPSSKRRVVLRPDGQVPEIALSVGQNMGESETDREHDDISNDAGIVRFEVDIQLR